MSIEKIDEATAAVIRKFFDRPATVNELLPETWDAAHAARAQHPDWRLLIQSRTWQGEKLTCAYLEKDEHVKLVGVWNVSSRVTDMDFPVWAKDVIRSVASGKPDSYAQNDPPGSFFWRTIVPVSLLWVALFLLVPPLWHGVLEFRRSFPSWYHVVEITVFTLSLLAWWWLKRYLYKYWIISRDNDLYLIEQYRERTQQSRGVWRWIWS